MSMTRREMMALTAGSMAALGLTGVPAFADATADAIAAAASSGVSGAPRLAPRPFFFDPFPRPLRESPSSSESL